MKSIAELDSVDDIRSTAQSSKKKANKVRDQRAPDGSNNNPGKQQQCAKRACHLPDTVSNPSSRSCSMYPFDGRFKTVDHWYGKSDHFTPGEDL
jgi:hypothetical protein